jgi:uncharacterized protein (TIGR04255 family)
MGDKLKKPPLIEALCEFRFDPSSPWDWTIPGQLFDKIGHEFSERSQVQGLGVQIQVGPGPAPTTHLSTGPERVQLRRPDGSAMVQVGPHLMAVNHLRPYPQWETFRGLIMRVFSTYSDVTHTTSLSRIGLRYINQIELPAEPVEIGDFSTLKPPLLGPLDRPLQGFYQRYEIVQDAPVGVLIHQTGIQKSEERRVIIVDLDFGSHEVTNIQDATAVEAWLDLAHERVEEAFIASLNPALYERMKRGDV